MPRPQQLQKDGIRRTITFRPDLDEKLAVLAAQRRVPISLVVEDLLELALKGPATTEDLARKVPPGWDGLDLYSRMITLRMRQKDLASLLGVNSKTLSGWVRGAHPYPMEVLEQIKKVLKTWKPEQPTKFRIGSRSPIR